MWWTQPKVTCPLCGVHFRLPMGFAGETIGCPGCWKVVATTNLISAPPPAWWRSRLRQVLNWGASWMHPDDPAKSVGFLENSQWALDYSPWRAGEDYALAREYAEKRYEELLKLSEVLDKKLDDLARTSLAIGILIATAARLLGSEMPFGRSPMLLWALISFALSVLVAVWSRGPSIFRTPLQIRGLLKVMDDHPELTRGKMEALLASSYHVAVVGTNAFTEWKARQLWRATSLLLVGIVLLVALLVTSGRSDSSPPSGGKVPDGKSQTGAVAAQETRSRSSASVSRSG